MAVDVLSTCSQSVEQAPSQLLSAVLTLVFAAYILVDSGIAAWVITRKAREAELKALEG